jgi:Ssl1-like
MSVQDLKPTRMICTVKLLEMFLEEFFDQNPISQLGMIVMKNKRAEKLSELAGSARKHIKSAQSLLKLNLNGEPSIQNGLELAIKSLKLVPSHASREIVMIMGSLTTCDPTDIHETIEVSLFRNFLENILINFRFTDPKDREHSLLRYQFVSVNADLPIHDPRNQWRLQRRA